MFHSRYEEAVTEREQEREQYRRGRRTRFAYPTELSKIPEFAQWVLEEVRREQQVGAILDPMVVDTARGPLNAAHAYKSMYAFGNHYRVLSSEQQLKTCDSGIAATFRQVCRNGTRDVNQVNADVEYVGHIEEILELNYRCHCVVVLVCDFVKANYVGENATVKRDKWGFTLANYERRYGSICRDSFAFPRHCEQVFFSRARESPGWRVVLRKEVRGRRVLPNSEDEEDAQLFQMGQDEDFEGLRPDREVGEQEIEMAATGEDVILQPVMRRNRATARGRGIRGRAGRGNRGGRAGRGNCGGRAGMDRPLPEVNENNIESEEDELQEEERGQRGLQGRRRMRAENGDHEQRNIRRNRHAEDDIDSNEATSSEEDASSTEDSTSEASSTGSEQVED
jgi:hypothetical protein